MTGSEARQALQQARNEIQSLLKAARSAVQKPASPLHGQHSSRVTLSSALDPIVDSRHLNNGRQTMQLSGLNVDADAASNAQTSQHMWQQQQQQSQSQQQLSTPLMSGRPFNEWQAASNSMSSAQEPGSRFNAPSGFNANAIGHSPPGFSSSHSSINPGYGQREQTRLQGLDMLGSGQGQCINRSALDQSRRTHLH